jgi:putative hemolysin
LSSAAWVWILLASALCSALFSALALSVGRATRAEVEALAERIMGKARAKRAQRVLDEDGDHMRALQLARLLFDGIACIAAVGWWHHLRTGGGTISWGMPVIAEGPSLVTPETVRQIPPLHVLDVLGGLGVAVVILWVSSVVLAMAVSHHAAARVLFARSDVIRGVRILLSPLAAFGRIVDEIVRRLIGAERKDDSEQAEEDILQIVEEAEASGALETDEAEMLNAVVRFGDLTVGQIMTPRTDVEAIEMTNDLGALIRQVREVKHSRIPVYLESIDQIQGLFYVKDLMLWLGGEGAKSGKPFELRTLLRPAYFVPETKSARELLNELMHKKVHIAIVADEYGGTAGIVTIEDIVEEIFGDIKDEYENPTAEMPDVILKAEEKSAELDAAARILNVNELIESLGVSIPESDDYDTVGGFVVTTLGRIPAAGEQFELSRMKFTVIEAKPTKVVRVGLEVMEEATPADVMSEDKAGA